MAPEQETGQAVSYTHLDVYKRQLRGIRSPGLPPCRYSRRSARLPPVRKAKVLRFSSWVFKWYLGGVLVSLLVGLACVCRRNALRPPKAGGARVTHCPECKNKHFSPLEQALPAIRCRFSRLFFFGKGVSSVPEPGDTDDTAGSGGCPAGRAVYCLLYTARGG